jgi:hypothetical protein
VVQFNRSSAIAQRDLTFDPVEQTIIQQGMKITDDYTAKVRLWAQNPIVVPLPQGPAVPRFAAQRFRNYEEMNRWKRDLILRMARQSG